MRLRSRERGRPLRGLRPGESLDAARRKLHIGSAIHVGRNDWYMAPGAATGVIKVRGGVVREIGIADAGLTRDRKPQITLITSTHFS